MENKHTFDHELLQRFCRYMHIKKCQHHVTIHNNGRCIIRECALNFFNIPDTGRVYVNIKEDYADLLFSQRLNKGSALVHPLFHGKRCACVYFYSRKISKKIASLKNKRFRFEGKGEWIDNDTYCIRLVFNPVYDIYELISNN